MDNTKLGRASASEIGRYRTGVAKMLAKLVAAAGETEQWLDVAMDGHEVSTRAAPEDDPTGAFRITAALLLRKARLHMIAMLRANKNSNVHSLAVQMRPILECAGQVVRVFHNLHNLDDPHNLKPGRGVSVVRGYLNADYYQTIIRLTKGDVGHKQLLTTISAASGMSKKEMRKDHRSLNQVDRVAVLEGGKDWCDYLSEYFCHGSRADWKGHSWQGGVSSINTVWDEFTFAGLMDYLVHQVAVMNAYAALCPVNGDVPPERAEAALTLLQEVRTTSKALRDGGGLAVGNPDEEGLS